MKLKIILTYKPEQIQLKEDNLLNFSRHYIKMLTGLSLQINGLFNKWN